MPNAKTCQIPTMTIHNHVGTSCDEHTNVSFILRLECQKRVASQPKPWLVHRQTNLKDFFRSFQGLRFLHKFKIGIFNPLLNTSCMAKTHHAVIYHFYLLSHSWSRYFFTSRNKALQNDLQLHLRYKSSIWNKKTKINIVHTQNCFYVTPEFYRFLHLGWTKLSPFPQQKDLFKIVRTIKVQRK